MGNRGAFFIALIFALPVVFGGEALGDTEADDPNLGLDVPNLGLL